MGSCQHFSVLSTRWWWCCFLTILHHWLAGFDNRSDGSVDDGFRLLAYPSRDGYSSIIRLPCCCCSFCSFGGSHVFFSPSLLLLLLFLSGYMQPRGRAVETYPSQDKQGPHYQCKWPSIFRFIVAARGRFSLPPRLPGLQSCLHVPLVCI